MSIKFDPSGFGDYFSMTTADADPTAFTICAWIKCISAGQLLIRTDSSGPGAIRSFFFYVAETGAYGAGLVYDGAEKTAIGTTPLNDQRWHHLAVTAINNGNMLTYVDGILEATTAIGTINTAGDRYTFAIGGGGASYGGYYEGWAEDIRTFHTVLTAQQIKILASYYPFPMGGEIQWWDCVNYMAVGHPDDFILVANTNFLHNLTHGTDGDPQNSPRSFASEVNPQGARAFVGMIPDMLADRVIETSMILDVSLVNEDL